jgi:predicted nucleic acid-binding protein
MTAILVDSNVLIDLLTVDAQWYAWSSAAIARAGDVARLVINPIIYAEVSIRFSRVEDVEAAFPPEQFSRQPIPFPAAFLAGKVFNQYRRRGGQKTAPLPDFFIGAHAAVAGYPLLTRDAPHYRQHFPRLTLITP